MNKLYHYGFLAMMALPFNIIAILCMKISYWIVSTNKEKSRYTYAQIIKDTFNVRDELEKMASQRLIKFFEEKMHEERIKWQKENERPQ